MAAVPLGIVLGALNVLVIAIGMGVLGGEPGIVLLVTMFGIVPAIVLGALLGWIADVMKPLPIWLRRTVLVVPAILLVCVLGAEFSMQQLIFVSSIPTVVASLILERATRLNLPPPVPEARARRSS